MRDVRKVTGCPDEKHEYGVNFLSRLSENVRLYIESSKVVTFQNCDIFCKIHFSYARDYEAKNQ